MAYFNKYKLSGSTDGRGIKVVATATAGTTIHTARSGTSADQFDEIYLFASKPTATDVLLTIEFGGTTTPDDYIVVTVKAQAGLQMVVPGLILQNGVVVRAFAGTANVITLFGFVNRISG